MKLPCAPNIESIPTEPPQPKPTIKTPLVTASDTPRNMKVKEVKKAAKQKIKKEQKKKIKEITLGEPGEPTGTSAKGQTFAENLNWSPSTSSVTDGGPYRLPSFDARRVIYPGANKDPWWDMPQLIAQVSVFLHCDRCA